MTNQMNVLLSQFGVGDRVRLHPATDRFARGDRFGVVEKVGRFYVHVRMDRSGQVVPFAPEDVQRLEGGEV